ncbi:hypothetical protein G1H11_01640 [Phytoactinopolyspora alkaliphila]|uniref:Uncharacterized protein n=1 Tax=Phytoactinopolyspora alkaliphila TaxID=1783498 RepID=A0A6N9YGF0_9ACTN|nr:hypothetical protein [Phytoactinopolyspora alkaliphila]NED94010.1 hypothetical protein [Phytoactinopolyspora alkaliphila]
MSRTRYLTGVLAISALTVSSVAALHEPAQAQPDVPPPPELHDGDLLLENHGFEDGLSGWTATNGRGEEPPGPCTDSLSISTDWSSQGDQSLQVSGEPPCVNMGAASTPVQIEAGETYAAFAHVRTETQASVGFQWVDDDGAVIDTSYGSRKHGSGIVEVRDEAPAGATHVAVEVGARGPAEFDDVVITAPFTVLPPQITRQASYLGMAAGVDENGRHVTYAMATGSEHDPAILTVTDIITGEVVRNVRLPGATGAWGIRQNPVTKTVYIGTYGAPDLWLYTPGDDEATNAGRPPIQSWGFMYDMDFDDDGIAYGGGWGEPTDGFAGAALYKFSEDDGYLGTLGPNPLVTDANYSRAVAYEEQTKTIFTGTGTNAHLIGCSTEGEPRCKDLTGLFSPELQEATWVYGITAGDGYVMAWTGDSSSLGNDSLVVLDVSRDSDGELQAEVIAEIEAVIYNGSSPVVDGKIYYSKANEPGQPLYAFDVHTGEEVSVPDSDTGIFSRRWEAVELDDPDWPGTTLVGWNSGGILVKYNIETGTLERTVVDGIPHVSTRINNVAAGPEGTIWSAGYLIGGLGGYTPMRDDEQVTYTLGGQAEAMISHDGRVYQGRYPYGHIESFIADEVASGQAPRVDCEIGFQQNRPYGLLGHGDRVYYGSQAEYGHDRGAFGWLDTETGECTTLDVVGHQSINTIAASGSKVFGGGNIFFGYDGTPIDDQAELLIFDEETEEARTIQWPIEGTRSVNAAATAPDGTVWFYAEGWLLAIAPDTEEWVHSEHVFPDWKPGDRIAGNYGEMTLNVDGRIYGNVGGRVFGFDPAETLAEGTADGNLEILMQGRVGPGITSDAYGHLYLSYTSTKLLRIDPGLA